MNTVKMPGFTAANSLRYGNKRYAAPSAISEKSHSAGNNGRTPDAGTIFRF
jgi:hypothetical protein